MTDVDGSKVPPMIPRTIRTGAGAGPFPRRRRRRGARPLSRRVTGLPGLRLPLELGGADPHGVAAATRRDAAPRRPEPGEVALERSATPHLEVRLAASRSIRLPGRGMRRSPARRRTGRPSLRSGDDDSRRLGGAASSAASAGARNRGRSRSRPSPLAADSPTTAAPPPRGAERRPRPWPPEVELVERQRSASRAARIVGPELVRSPSGPTRVSNAVDHVDRTGFARRGEGTRGPGHPVLAPR